MDLVAGSIASWDAGGDRGRRVDWTILPAAFARGAAIHIRHPPTNQSPLEGVQVLTTTLCETFGGGHTR